jgi:hypoxia up-regulated 1
VSTEEQRDTFRAQLTSGEDWLYMDPEAEAGTAATFKAKLKELMATGDPIKMRAYESSRRAERVEGAKLLVDLVRQAEATWPKSKPWLNATHVQKLVSLVRCVHKHG